MLNIVVPMAGRGSRFVNEGYRLPKPLILIHGKAMIQIVINNLKPKSEHKFIFLCLKDHLERYNLRENLQKWAIGSKIIEVDKVTEGAACTVLLAKDLINNNSPLMIANCDQYVDFDINDYLKSEEDKDGLIMTMRADDPKWSYVKFDKTGKIIEVVEKQVVSNEASVGIYNFRQGRDFVNAAESMIKKNTRVNNEFYVAPAYNEMIAAGKNIGIYNVGAVLDGMYGLGTPSDLKEFLNLDISKKAANY